jgi:hypothetical protein
MKNVEQLRKEFETLVYDNITREGVDNLLNYLNTSDFYRSPASTKYHGSYAGGLVEHSINVYYSLIDELTFILGKEWEKRYSKETVTIVSLFHDICKIGRYKPGKRNVKDPVTGQWHEEPTYFYNEDYVTMGHGSLSVYRIMQFMQLTEVEAGAIYWHMGAYDIGNYNTIGDLSNHYTNNILAFALHRADMMATYVVENEKFEPIDL